MTLLTRYLVKQNLFLLLAILISGTSLYLLTESFDNMDRFVETEAGFGYIALYLVAKTPLIISRILPAVFLLALVAQLNILQRTREMIALMTGGITPMVLIRFVLIYGLIWCGVQFFFSEFVGIHGERLSIQVWTEEIRDGTLNKAMGSKWFTQKDFLIYLAHINADDTTGNGFRAYRLSESGLEIEEMINAESFIAHDDHWTLTNVTRIQPNEFRSDKIDTLDLSIKQDLEDFRLLQGGKSLVGLPLWELYDHIKQLRNSGSNVEAMVTAMHGKMAYAVSIIIMGLFALIISQVTSSIYKAVFLGIILTFLFYALSTFTMAMGERGLINPVLAAWAGIIASFVLCGLWFAKNKILRLLRLR